MTEPISLSPPPPAQSPQLGQISSLLGGIKVPESQCFCLLQVLCVYGWGENYCAIQGARELASWVWPQREVTKGTRPLSLVKSRGEAKPSTNGSLTCWLGWGEREGGLKPFSLMPSSARPEREEGPSVPRLASATARPTCFGSLSPMGREMLAAPLPLLWCKDPG